MAAGVVCTYHLDEVGKTHHCTLTNEPIPINWGFCFNNPQNCPRVRLWAAGSVAIKDSVSEDQLNINIFDNILTELEQKLEAADIAGLATQLTLAAVLTELGQKLEAADLATLEGLDYAEETTLVALLTELGQKLEATDLATLEGIDFAEQTTLALIKAKTDNLNAQLSTLATQTTLASLLTELAQKLEPADLATLEGIDYAEQTTLALIKAKTDNLNAQLSTLATQTTLANLLTELQGKPEDLEFTGVYKITAGGANEVNQLANHSCLVTLLQSEIANTGKIYWGFSNATLWYCLEAGESASIPCSNSNKIWTKIVVNGEIIVYGTWA